MAPACPALTNDYKTEIQTDITLQPLIKSQKWLAVAPEHQAVLVLVTKILLFYDVFNPGIKLLVHLRLGDIAFGAKFHRLNRVFHRAVVSHQEEQLMIPLLPHPTQNVCAVLSALIIQHEVGQDYVVPASPFNKPFGLLDRLAGNSLYPEIRQCCADGIAVGFHVVNDYYLTHPSCPRISFAFVIMIFAILSISAM